MRRRGDEGLLVTFVDVANPVGNDLVITVLFSISLAIPLASAHVTCSVTEECSVTTVQFGVVQLVG